MAHLKTYLLTKASFVVLPNRFVELDLERTFWAKKIHVIGQLEIPIPVMCMPESSAQSFWYNRPFSDVTQAMD